MNFKEQLNRLANSYALHENTAEKKKTLNEMAVKLYENENKIYYKYFESNFSKEQKLSIIYDVLLKTIKSYKSDKNTTFYTYFSNALENEYCSMFKKIKRENIELTDMTEEIDNKSEEEKIYEKTNVSALMVSYINLIINFYKYNKGRAANKTRYEYFKMFYTDTIGELVRTENLGSLLEEKEDRIFEAINQEFQDSYTVERADTIKKLEQVEYKKHCEVTATADESVLENPVPNDVFNTFYNKLTGEKTTTETVSQQKKNYKEYINSGMK